MSDEVIPCRRRNNCRHLPVTPDEYGMLSLEHKYIYTLQNFLIKNNFTVCQIEYGDKKKQNTIL